MLMLKQCQQLIKDNGIDQGLLSSKRHSKNKAFGRDYENHMKPEIFSQVFADAMLDEPEIASIYYPRTDSVLLALYNKSPASGQQETTAQRLPHEKVKAV